MAKITGVKEIKKAIARHKGASAKGIEIGLKRAGLALQRESMKVVPIDTNTLRSTANTRAIGTGHKTEVIVSYNTDYAVYVHENLEARHKPGKQAKFLEGPFREKRKYLKGIIVAAILEETIRGR